MVKIEIRKGESIDKALRKFKTLTRREGLIDQIKEKEHYTKPNEKRRAKLAKAVRREQKRQREED